MTADPTRTAPLPSESLRALRDLLLGVPRAATRDGGSDGSDGGARPSVDGSIGALAARALDRLERDLLPRTAGGDGYLVVGIVGPNNAGKSALFNGLVARAEEPLRERSPSRAVGGATRRLVGALHPDLRRRLEADPASSRFPLRTATLVDGCAHEATLDAGDPSELLVIEDDGLPVGLLLVDTPDFDSVLRQNRGVAAALLGVADVAVVVVTRHTYQNRDVVDFLQQWLAHGRPWILVYNEALDADTTRRHACKLAEDVGSPPEEVFSAEHDVAIAEGARALVPVRLDGTSLTDVLRDRDAATDLKARALSASRAQLGDDLTALVGLLRQDATEAEAHLGLVARRSAGFGRTVARETMPTAVFLDAFRAVLDRRPTLVQRRLRGGLRWGGEQLGAGAQWIRSRLTGADAATPPDPLELAVEAERRAIERHWSELHEGLVGDLRPLRDASAADGDAPDERLFRALHSDLGGSRAETLAAATAAAGAEADELAAFGRTCEALVEAELERGRSEWALQLGVDALHLLPAVAAGAVILQTGGLGADVAVAGGGALSSVLAERLSRLLGSAVASEARERWAERRGTRLAELGSAAVLPTSLPLLSRRATERLRLAEEIDRWLGGQSRRGEGR